VELALRDLFESRTVAALAALLGSEAASSVSDDKLDLMTEMLRKLEEANG
jgi:hypothetical protein